MPEGDVVGKGEVIETTVSKVAAELARRGLDPHDRVTITIEPDELIPGRREARARVVAAGLTDEDIDRLIDEARIEAQPQLGGSGAPMPALSPNSSLGARERGSRRSRASSRSTSPPGSKPRRTSWRRRAPAAVGEAAREGRQGP
jgi:hypothetical protein